MSNSSKVILAAIIILILAGAYYLLATNPSGSNDNIPVTQTVDISGTEYKYTPDRITVKSGERIRINFKNNGTMPHNFTLDGANAATRTISSGQTTSVDFTAPAAGSYNFYCTVSGHRNNGMEGTLTVE